MVAGLPKAIAWSGTSVRTYAPGATIEFFPIVIPAAIIEFLQI